MADTDALVGIYLTIRREREKLKAEFDAQDGELKEDMTRLEQALLAICNDTNTNGLKTSHGTVTRQVKERFFALTGNTSRLSWRQKALSICLNAVSISATSKNSYLVDRPTVCLPE